MLLLVTTHCSWKGFRIVGGKMWHCRLDLPNVCRKEMFLEFSCILFWRSRVVSKCFSVNALIFLKIRREVRSMNIFDWFCPGCNRGKIFICVKRHFWQLGVLNSFWKSIYSRCCPSLCYLVCGLNIVTGDDFYEYVICTHISFTPISV